MTAIWVREGLDDWVTSYLERELATALDAHVSIGWLHVRPLRLHVEFADLEIRTRGSEDAGLALRVDRGAMGLSWKGVVGLPSGTLHFREISLDRPYLSLGRPFLEGRTRAGNSLPPVDLGIGRLEIKEGSLLYGDVEIPLELRARNLDLRASSGFLQRGMRGEAAVELELMRPLLDRPLPVDLRTEFRWSGGRLDLLNLGLEGPGLDVEFSEGHLSLEEGLPFVAQGRARADLDQFGAWLEEGFPALSGRVEGEFKLERGPGPVHLSGNFLATHAVFGPLQAANARGLLDYEPGSIRVTGVHASAYGGEISGNVLVELEAAARFSAEVSGRKMDLQQLLELAGRPLPVASQGELRMELEGEAGDLSTWSASGSLDATPAMDGRGGVPAGISGSFTLDQGRFRVESARVESAHTALELFMDLDLLAPSGTTGRIRLEGSTLSAQRAQSDALSVLEALGVEANPALREPLSGRGNVSLEVEVGKVREIRMTLHLFDGEWWHQSFGEGQVELNVRDGRLTLSRVFARDENWDVNAAGSFDLSSGSIVSLEAVVTDMPVVFLTPLLGVDWGMGGRLSGQAGMKRGPRGLDGSGDARVEEFEILGERIEKLETSFAIRGDRLDLFELQATGPALDVDGKAVVDLPSGFFQAKIGEGRVDLSRLENLARLNLEAEGEAVLSGVFRRTQEGFTGEMGLKGPGWHLAGFGLGNVRGELSFHPEGLDFRLSSGKAQGINLEGRLGWSEELPLTTVLYLDRTPWEIALGRAGTAWGRLDGHLLLEGPARTPERFTARGSLESGELHLGTGVLRTRAPVPLELKDQSLVVGPLQLEGHGSDLTAQVRYDLGAGEIQAGAEGTVNAGILAAIWPRLRTSGDLRMSVDVAGSLESPRIRGSIQMERGRARILGFPEPFEDIRLGLEIEGQTARLERLQAHLGGGEVTGAGVVQFKGLIPDSYSLDVDIANARLSYPEGFKGAYEGQLRLQGDPDSATLQGDLTLIRGLYDKEFEVTELLGYGAREYATTETVELPVELLLDVRLQADGDVWIRNDLAELESRLDLHFGGDVRRPELTGRVWVHEGGIVRFRDVEYEVQSGSLDLIELQRINPYVDLRAETQIREYHIVLRVEGTLDKLDYKLTSEPSLSPQDIIALLTTNQTLEDLTATGGAGTGIFTGDLVANYFASALTQPFERQLQKLLGLERVRIDPLLVEGQADPTTRITLGKQVGESVSITYSTDLGSKTERRLYQVEWQASKKFRFVAERSTTGGIGSDIRYADRFWFRRPDGSEERVDSREPALPDPDRPRPAEGLGISEVRVEGGEKGEVSDLLKSISIRPGEVFQRSSMLEGAQEIRRILVGEGRIEARVVAESVPVGSGGEGVRVIYRLELGPRVLVEVEGIRGKDQKRIQNRLQNLWLDSVFQDELYEEAAELIMGYLHEQGYYAADVFHVEEYQEGVRTVRFKVDPGEPVKVEAVQLEGVEGIAEQKIRRQMFTRTYSAFARNPLVPGVLQEDVVAVRNLYRENGFLRVMIEPPLIRLSSTGNSAQVTMKIHEGPSFTMAELDAPEGLPFPRTQLLEWAGLRPGDFFSPKRLAEAESSLRVQLDRHGYPEVRVGSSLEVEGDEVQISFSVEPGELKKVGAIEIRGNRRTRQNVIRRELFLEPGDPISRDRLLQTQHRLYKLGIFRSVRLSWVPLGGARPDLQKVIVQVEEGPPLAMVLGAGYDTEGGPRGTFSFSHTNPGGRNRKVAFHGRGSRIEKRLQWTVQDPRLFGRRSISGLLNLFWENREEVSFTEDRRAVALRVEKKLAKRWTQFFRYNFQKVDLSDVEDLAAAREQKLEDLKLGDLAYTVVRETRDDPFTPTRGGHGNVGLRVFAPAFLSEASFVKLFFQGSTVHTFRNHTVFASAMRLGVSQPFGDTVSIPLSERFFAGGDSTLRGFPRDGVGPVDPDTGLPTGGEALFLLNEEWRFPIWRALKGALFYDAGNVYSDVESMDLTDLRHVLGLGLRLETPLGPFRLEYGHKVDREAGESAGELFLAIGAVF